MRHLHTDSGEETWRRRDYFVKWMTSIHLHRHCRNKPYNTGDKRLKKFINNTLWRKKNAFFFSNNCNLFIFNIKNYVNTKTTCNKCSFDYLHWLLNYGKLYRKDGILLAVHTSGASPQSSASHLLTFLVAQLQFLREWKLSDHRLYEVFERRLLIWDNPKERNSPDYYPFQKHAFFLRHPV